MASRSVDCDHSLSLVDVAGQTVVLEVLGVGTVVDVAERKVSEQMRDEDTRSDVEE